MPPKAKKIDPELQAKQFEQWKESDEYRIWSELQIIYKSMENNISETSKDLTGNWQVYHDKLLEVCQIFKCKSKLKQIEHCHMRSAFFAVEDVEINKTVVKQYLDGFYYSVEKQDKDRAKHVKELFAKIARTLEDHKFFDINAENYIAERKAFVGLLNDFLKKLPILIKSSHKVIEEKLMLVLGPLRALLEINKKMMFFDLVNTSNQARQTKDFILKADIEQYCICLQEAQRLLLESKAISCNPNVKLIFNKLGYEGWQQNKIESFYLTPLQEAFDKMRNNLLCLMLKGINYYKAPLMDNTQFVEDVKELIDAELIAEHLMGTSLKRDQLNFTYKVLSVISNSNAQAKEFLIKRDDNCIKGSIPKLITYHTILYMRAWKDRKIADELKEQKLQQKTQPLAQSNLFEAQSAMSGLSPDKKRQADDDLRKKEEDNMKIQEKLDFEKYGRFWIWEYYAQDQMKANFEECVELIRHINQAVQQDIEDVIIKEGMVPKNRPRQVQQNDPSQMFNKLQEKDNANIYVIQRRPPELWNYPKIVEEQHEFRAIAKPRDCYKDGRIQILESKMEQLSTHLENNKPQSWNELIHRVIDALSNQYNKKPSAIEPGK
ncbi:unnamed protein product [Paramecium pentaurelia]|uniref:Uncharacterized protein n=1 Tax=Paramecium pentaurelia TaxID=43138 RepID=A0A8S1VEN2_9CILI|nr:unnamed protein product [Paramecium pentaurelia]